MNNNKKNFPPPPSGSLFDQLDYFWDHGVGNTKDLGDIPVSWSEETLEAALDFKPSAKALRAWRQRRSIPSRGNIHRLCKILLAESPEIQRQWVDALLTSRRDAELSKKLAEHSTSQPFEVKSSAVSTTNQRSKKVINLTLGAMLVAAVVALTYTLFATQRVSPSISQIRFCSEEFFSDQRMECTENTTRFEAGTTKVYVSFQSDGIPYATPFSRRWYRNGEKFLERNDFFDDTWKNYTWIFNRHGHDLGEYSMRIIVGNSVFSGRFTVSGS